MIFNTIRILADWYADGTSGINARLATVPKDAGDAVPPSVTIRDSTRDDQVARRHLTDQFPAPSVIVFHPVASELDGWIGVGLERAAGLTVATGYVTRKSVTATGVVDGWLTLRAAKQSINALMQGNEAARTRNSVRLLRVVRDEISETMAEVGDTVVQIVRVTTFQAEDIAP